MNETESCNADPEGIFPDVDKEDQSNYGQAENVNLVFSSVQLQVSSSAEDGRQATRDSHTVQNQEDPFTGLTRCALPKFKVEKRSFESRHAGIKHRHTEVLPEQKLFRLYKCLQEEALFSHSQSGLLSCCVRCGRNKTSAKIAYQEVINSYKTKRGTLRMKRKLKSGIFHTFPSSDKIKVQARSGPCSTHRPSWVVSKWCSTPRAK